MTSPLPAPLILRAVAHGLVACAIVAVVALLWVWLPGGRDSALALATVGGIGALAWSGAMVAVRAGLRPRPAVNDNHPYDPLVLTWAPIADPQATARALSR